MAVPNIFATATSSIPLSQLDTNFATAITLGSTALYLGNTTTSVAGLTVTGGAFNGTVGATTPSTGAFTSLSSTIGANFATSSGSVGIGTASPNASANTTIKQGSSTYQLQLEQSNATDGYGLRCNAADGALSFSRYASSAYTERMRIEASGNVGIGTTAPGVNLDVVGTSGARVKYGAGSGLLISQASSGGTANINNQANASLVFGTNNTDQMRIDASGNLLLNTTSVLGAGKQSMFFNGASEFGLNIKTTYSTTNGSTYVGFYEAAGSQIGGITQATSTTVAYNTSSDYRLKENVAPLANGLTKVMALKPCNWTWKTYADYGEGFIAHELAEVCPNAVTGQKDAVDANGNPVYQGIDTSFLVATLTAAIQEQQTLITTLTARITALENK